MRELCSIKSQSDGEEATELKKQGARRSTSSNRSKGERRKWGIERNVNAISAEGGKASGWLRKENEGRTEGERRANEGRVEQVVRARAVES
jgi:hypothetical protein